MVREAALDLWICEHYRVLPTEERYKRLSDRQKYLLFLGFVEQPKHDDMHKAYRNSNTHSFSDNEKRNLRNIGYTPEQLKRIQDQLGKAGLNG